jgi:hypothetical protein
MHAFIIFVLSSALSSHLQTPYFYFYFRTHNVRYTGEGRSFLGQYDHSVFIFSATDAFPNANANVFMRVIYNAL